MNALFNALLQTLRSLSLSQSFVVIALSIVVAFFIMMSSSWKLINDFRGKSLSFSDKRFSRLMQALKQYKFKKMHPLELELVFRRAYGYRYSSDEIIFALSRSNTSELLFAIRYGRNFVKLNLSKSGFELMKVEKRTLEEKEKIADRKMQIVVIPILTFALLFSFLEPMVGIPLFIEMFWVFFMLAAQSRSLLSAQRLLSMERYPFFDDVAMPRKEESSMLIDNSRSGTNKKVRKEIGKNKTERKNNGLDGELPAIQ